jgi:hypothetical protein
MWLCKNFSHIKFSHLFFPDRLVKLKLGLQTGERLLRAKHVDESLSSTNQKYGAPVRSDQIYYTIYRHVHTAWLCCTFYQNENTVKTVAMVQFIPICAESVTGSAAHWAQLGIVLLACWNECNIKKSSGPDHKIREPHRQYAITLAESTLIILFSELLKFSQISSSKSKNIVKDNTQYLGTFHLLKWIFQN